MLENRVKRIVREGGLALGTYTGLLLVRGGGSTRSPDHLTLPELARYHA
jgi:hypothetical protein